MSDKSLNFVKNTCQAAFVIASITTLLLNWDEMLIQFSWSAALVACCLWLKEELITLSKEGATLNSNATEEVKSEVKAVGQLGETQESQVETAAKELPPVTEKKETEPVQEAALPEMVKFDCVQAECPPSEALDKGEILLVLKRLPRRTQKRQLCKKLGAKGYGKLNSTEAFTQHILNFNVSRTQFEQAVKAVSA
ncbi:MAG: hypothetical protein F6J89_23560 [Symploca sp. SIO1C4]|uniref:Uncharacterized protein n=1 Tax=Symploca sp. SIO1C4 TaxID=2607765 RepID=A0A6B3NK62_9CYAN|nr:hypothetical protein [Symploca sp. SIO1C4]